MGLAAAQGLWTGVLFTLLTTKGCVRQAWRGSRSQDWRLEALSGYGTWLERDTGEGAAPLEAVMDWERQGQWAAARVSSRPHGPMWLEGPQLSLRARLHCPVSWHRVARLGPCLVL